MPIRDRCEAGPTWGRYRLTQSNEPLTFHEVIDLWQHSDSFPLQFSRWLCDAPYEAIYFECRPLNEGNAHLPFEYVVADASPLAGRTEDRHAFANYFDAGPVVTFANLGGDAELVVPCPTQQHCCYAHLKVFLATGNNNQIRALWQTVGDRIKAALNESPVWLSTSGLGVSWLHVRIDQFPKYYTHTPYRSL